VKVRALLASLIFTATVGSPAAAQLELWQTNPRGDDIHVFDVETRRLLLRIVVGLEPHGLAAPRDAGVVYVTLEANGRPRGELLWIDPRSYRFRHRMELCREPHAIATVEHRVPLGWFLLHPQAGWEGLQRCHGLAICPDQTDVWSVCGAGVTVHDPGEPGFEELAHVLLEYSGYWITFSPDSRFAFVAHLDAGDGPKRNLVIDRARVPRGPE